MLCKPTNPFSPEDGHKTEICSGYLINIQTSVALDGNPEPDLVHATGCKQPTLSTLDN
jgi:hypothetical protein